MCGIVGLFDPNGLSTEFKDQKILQDMTMTLEHRGPDEKGVLLSDIACLGHARLSIIDIDNGQQPMCDTEKKLSIVFNGEIYNYIELRKELQAKNYNLRTHSDTETLLYLYREYGSAMLEKLNGQFAFAIVDFDNKKIFAARDRLGIRPFYYTEINGTFIFASSLKAITTHKAVNKEINYNAFDQYPCFWSTYGENTFFKHINQLRPGEYLEYSDSGFRKSLYWDLEFPDIPEQHSLKEWKSCCHEALLKATEIRLRADVPVNAYLSGGLDSSITLKLMQKIHPDKLESFSVRFNDNFYDETDYQNILTESTGIKNHSIIIGSENIGQAFINVISNVEHPIFRTAPVPLYYLSNLVNKHNYKVVLTGEGADEISYGYNLFKENIIRANLAKNPDDQFWLEQISKLNPHLTQYDRKYQSILQNFYKKSISSIDDTFFTHRIKIQNGSYIQGFYSKDLKNQLNKKEMLSEIEAELPNNFKQWTVLQRTQYLEMKTLLTGYLLSAQGDRMSMAHSIEGRYPFLDHNVIELFAKMPDSLKLNEMNEKFILKETFKNYLPPPIVDRPKHPYRAPEAVSLINHEIDERYFNEKINSKYQLFDWDKIKRLKKKVVEKIKNANFNDNFAYVFMVSSLIFLEQFSESQAPRNKKASFNVTTL